MASCRRLSLPTEKEQERCSGGWREGKEDRVNRGQLGVGGGKLNRKKPKKTKRTLLNRRERGPGTEARKLGDQARCQRGCCRRVEEWKETKAVVRTK